ncbi:major capsid protein [Microbacterium phage Erenyeager]|nr:major capsid protein [Microbacterium phage Erenyeager]
MAESLTLMETVTKNGRLPLFNKRLSESKIAAADDIIAGIRENDNRAILEFKEHLGARRGEAIHTTGDDFIHAFAQLTALEVTNRYEANPRTWRDAIETETVSTFDTPLTYTIKPVVDGLERPQTEPGKPGYVPPLVPEGSPYPHFKFSGERSAQGSIHKRGGRYDMTFEEIIRDVATLVPLIPNLITDALLDAEEYDAWAGLIAFINVPENHLQAGTTFIGQAVTTDSVLTPAALDLALTQAMARQINGVTVNVSSYNLLVPRGASRGANQIINGLVFTGQTQQSGLTVNQFAANGYNPFQSISGVVETEYLTGTQWALIPAKGAVRGQDKFYALGQLAGHIGPELRLENVTGQYLGGGDVSPFEGDFETDSAAFRGRIIEGPLGWNSQYAVISNGTGAA